MKAKNGDHRITTSHTSCSPTTITDRETLFLCSSELTSTTIPDPVVNNIAERRRSVGRLQAPRAAAIMLSTSMTSQRSPTPVDQDLQTLYDEVWAGFAMEEPSSAVSSERDLDHIYSVYGADSEFSPSPTSHGPNTRQELPIPSSRPSRNTPSPSPISGSGSVRRLPPTPRSAHISTPSFSMPEPDVYEPQHRPSLSSSESYSPGNSSSDMLRGPLGSSKTGSMSGRRLPAPPTASPRHPSDARALSSNGTGDPPYRASPPHNNHGSGDSSTAHNPVPFVLK
ncbi:hypothetical protein F5146DRAFT_1202971 [Armillaria mellea]|nr:hypothetical protein F5146DRAFT_1202971 [Armillaria mellea]